VTQGLCARTYQPSLSLRRHPWNTPSLAHSRALCTIFRRVDSCPRHPAYICTPPLGTYCCPGAECAISASAVCMLTPGPSSAPPLHKPPNTNAAPSSEELSPQSRAQPFPPPSDPYMDASSGMVGRNMAAMTNNVGPPSASPILVASF
jgi:hypothetical protein